MFEDSPRSQAMLGAKPILLEDLEPFWEAFTILSQSRPPAFSGAAPIPLSEVAAYCDLFGYSKPSQRHQMVREVRRIDRIYLEVSSKARSDRQDRVQPQTGPKSKSGRRAKRG